jgi:CBS domain-containing protein
MARPTSATPLLALDAVVIDIETAAIDPREAAIVEVAAVRLVAGHIAPDAPFRRLIRPRQSVPASATAVNGIDDAACAHAPTFAHAWPEFAAFIADSVVIGHTLGFDLGAIKRECDAAGIAWVPPRTLDTRLLAQVAEPDLADYSLEALAAWLDVEIADRHSALADAMACAGIFVALLPRLREVRIRTLAEAERACRALTDVLDAQHRAGWVEPVAAPARADRERALERIDSYPYRHRIRDVMRTPPQFVAADTSLRAALFRMTGEHISSLYVRSPEATEDAIAASEAGIITERDLLRALGRHGGDALLLPVGRFMSRPLAAVPQDAFVYRAIGLMNERKIRHLGVVDDSGCVVGALSTRDLLRVRAGEALALGAEIDRAADAHALALSWAKLSHVATALLTEGVSPRDIAAVISRELGALTRQAAVIAERRMRDQGRGDPPCRYAVAVLGSAGRDESLLAMDQDNALFFAQGEPGGREDEWFAAFGGEMTDILHEAGIPYCRGGVMASRPQWRGSTATWQARIGTWIGRSSSEDLLSVDIFFDLRAVHGDVALAHGLRLQGLDAAKGQAAFAKLLVESAGAIERGLTLLGGFRTKRGRIDLKRTGLFGIVTAARALAVCHHVTERSTPARLAAVKRLGIGGEHDLDALTEAQGVFLDLILAQQIEDIEHGIPASNAVATKRLSGRDRDHLRQALRAVEPLEHLVRDLLFAR